MHFIYVCVCVYEIQMNAIEEKKDKIITRHTEKINKMTIIGISISVIISNVNILNPPLKICIMAQCINNKIQLYATYKSLALNIRTYIGRKWKHGGKNGLMASQKRAEVATHISDKTDFKSNNLIKDKQGYIIKW